MYYELSTTALVDPGSAICERRTRYRRNWYAEHDEPGRPHPITELAERRARSGPGRARFERLLALSEQIATTLMPDELRGEILELEELLHAHWLAVAGEHFNLGFEAGALRAALAAEVPAELPPRERLRALVAALQEAIEDL